MKALEIIDKSQKNEGGIPIKLLISQLLVALSYKFGSKLILTVSSFIQWFNVQMI